MYKGPGILKHTIVAYKSHRNKIKVKETKKK